MPSPDQSPPGFPARRAALMMLDHVLRRGETLDRASRFTAALPPADRALALAITGEVLRWREDLDALIDGATRQRLADDAKARMVLRLALAQKMAMNVPDHALVATALPLVDGGPRKLVHGVLGALLRRGVTLPAQPTLPPAVAERWHDQWGADMVAAASRLMAKRPPLDLSFKTEVASADFPEAVTLVPRHRRLAEVDGGVTSLPGFDAGDWWVQELAASLPARAVPASAKRVLDLCAAPGGKTMQLAAAGHEVTALDVSESRLARLKDNLARTGLTADVIVADALKWQPKAPFDAVLLDAPCSATGTFRRHPEVLTRASERFIAECADLQQRMLARAANWVAPGGSFVFSTCSLERGEGEGQIGALLAERPDFRLERIDVPVAGIAAASEGYVRILPGLIEEAGGIDGFFIAHLVRAR